MFLARARLPPWRAQPKTNTDYWSAKIARNRARDATTATRLAQIGWREVVVWECELRDVAALRDRLAKAFAASPRACDASTGATPTGAPATG